MYGESTQVLLPLRSTQPTLGLSADGDKGVRCHTVSGNGQASRRRVSQPGVIVANFPMTAGDRFDWHTHESHQLAWAAHGVLKVVVDVSTCVLPPTRALWIPAGLRHETSSNGPAAMRALYVQPQRSSIAWSQPTPVAITALVAELIAYLNDTPAGDVRRINAEAVLFDLLEPVPLSASTCAAPRAARPALWPQR